RALQVQCPSPRRLSESPQLCEAALSGTRRGRDRRLGPDQAPLLLEPSHDQSDPNRADRPRNRLLRTARPRATGHELSVRREARRASATGEIGIVPCQDALIKYRTCATSIQKLPHSTSWT